MDCVTHPPPPPNPPTPHLFLRQAYGSYGPMYNDDVTVYSPPRKIAFCGLMLNFCNASLERRLFSDVRIDIFSSLAGVTASRPELVFGALFGAGVFVTTVVAGTVAITQPFKVRKLQYSTSNSTVQVQYCTALYCTIMQ